MNGLYQDNLLNHYKNPRNCGVLNDADIISRQYNPACGDKVSVTAQVVDGKITDSKWQASGCVISVATASLLSDFIQNKFLDDIKVLDADAILVLIGMQLGPTRLKCALLPLYALKDGIKEL